MHEISCDLGGGSMFQKNCIHIKIIIVFVALSIINANGNRLLSCTAICTGNGESLFLAKNFDWEIDKGYLVVNSRGEEKITFNNSVFKKTWVSEYGSVTFTQYGKEFPLSGMNEAGLVVEELSTTSTLNDNSENHILINEFQWIQYQLDMFSSVREVLIHLDQFSISTLLFPVHYIVADRSGNVAVIELEAQGFKYYTDKDLPFKVLSNNKYAESLRYLRNFEGYGGDMPILNRKESCERFVKAADMLLKNDLQPNSNEMFLMLDTLKQSDTRWSIVYDISNLKIYYKFHFCVSKKCIDLKGIDFTGFNGTRGSNLSNCNVLNENDLKPLTKLDNEMLVEAVIDSMSKEFEVTDKLKTLKRMVLYGNQFLSE
ncbi:MAG: linear amide C-N hydrolase [Bacteroidales bacterium]|nr:linear amide C-N hydrolase [Bacteroidales bacterium]